LAAGDEFTPEAYREAAAEHFGRMGRAYDQDDFAWALFVAGLAVENLFRAYHLRVAREFDARHGLRDLARASKFADAVPPRQAEAYAAALGRVAAAWSSNDRFRPEAGVRRRLKRLNLDRGVKGDFLKEVARRPVSDATLIVSIGVKRWKT